METEDTRQWKLEGSPAVPASRRHWIGACQCSWAPATAFARLTTQGNRVMVEDDGRGSRLLLLVDDRGEASGDLYENMLWHCGRERG